MNHLGDRRWQAMQTWGASSLAVSQRILLELWHRKRSLVFWLVFPLVVMVLHALIFEDRSGLTFSEALQLAAPPSLVGAAFFFSGLGGTLAVIVAEREHRTLRRLLISPLSGSAYFCGIFLAQGAIAMAQTLAVGVAAWGWQAPIEGSLPLLALLLTLSLWSYVGGGLVLGTFLAHRTEDVNALVATFGVPLLILGGAFFPASIFPESLTAIAIYNPVYHMTEAVGGVWADGLSWGDIWPHGRFLLVFSAAMVFAGALAYRQLLQRERLR
ncbi:MAG: ABC transporter permease [Synechocystis sp.]